MVVSFDSATPGPVVAADRILALQWCAGDATAEPKSDRQ